MANTPRRSWGVQEDPVDHQSVKASAVPRRRPAGVRRERFGLPGELRRVRLVCSRSPCVNVCSASVHLPRVWRWRCPRRILSISKPITPSFQPWRYAHARNERGESVCTVQQCARRESFQSTASLCTLRIPCACAMQTLKRHAVLLARVMLLVTTCTGDVACQGEGKAHLLHYTFTHTFATRNVRTNVSDSRALGSAQACLAPEERCSVFVSSFCPCRRLH